MAEYGTMTPFHDTPTSYTPDEMKRVIQDALDQTNSPLSHLNTPVLEPRHSSVFTSTPTLIPSDSSPSSSPSSENSPDDPDPSPCKARLQRLTPHSLTPLLPHLSPTPPRSSHPSPIRPTPSHNPGTHTFSVEAPFLHAMIKLLERQANIVPAHLFTREDVQIIVQKEIDKFTRGKEEEERMAMEVARRDNSRERSKLAGYITLPDILIAAVGFAGIMVFRRACKVLPSETRGFVVEGGKGGFWGVLGAGLLRGILVGVDWLREGRRSFG
ncbi:hypothetical protein B0J11DRAFT_590752 [Dendryphion nanum]|uniref:Uncharacterized protein n=1 Tax=Dendryphion nanum TaxID=256645 RepID=A0A9P9DIF9_9PLEO|nr:hypothetical protein B0J11DRAFT_590752 [Dendryphion nanum]